MSPCAYCNRNTKTLAGAVLLAASCLSWRAPAQTGGLSISVGPPFTIAKSEQYLTWGYWCFPVLQKCTNGDLLLSFSTGADAFLATQVGPNLYRSTGLGQTWTPEELTKRVLSPRVQASFRLYNRKSPADGIGGGCLGGLAGFCNLADDTCIGYYYCTMRGQSPDIFVGSMRTSSDGGRTWANPTDVEFSVPGNALDGLGRGPAIWQRSVQLPNGNLVTVAHTLFAGQSKLRVIALGSSNRGRSWRYLATVAYDPNINTEGFTEPILCQNAQGRLICFMRTEGGQPMYQAFSSDGGNSWSAPTQAGVPGVAPDMHLLSNGVLACSYGRPGVNIMFSLDGSGHTWSNLTSIFTGNSTCYTSFAEVSPGRLLFIFDAIRYQESPAAKPANCIRGVYIDVARH